MTIQSNHPVWLAAQMAANQLKSLQLHQCALEPTKADADALIADVTVLWEIFDPVIEAMGRYAGYNLGLSEQTVKDTSVDVVRNALEGDLTYVIEQAFEDRVQQVRDDEAVGRR